MKSLLGAYRSTCAAMLAALAFPALASAGVIYIDPTLDPADYDIVQYRSTTELDITIQHLPGEPALQILYDLPLGSGDSMVGFIQPTFIYDPSIDGAIDHVDASAFRYVNFLKPGFVLTSSTWRPLIRQDDKYYQAVISIVPPIQGVYQFGDGSNLHASDFGLFDFGTGILSPGVNPDFNGTLMEFGFASRFAWTVSETVTVDVRYKNLAIEITSVPEPITVSLLGLGLLGVAARRRAR